MRPRQHRRPTSSTTRAGTSRRALVLAAAAIAGTILMAPAAGAKGALSARVVGGPGISAPLVISDRNVVLELAEVTKFYAALSGSTRTTGLIDSPTGDLGPRYVLEYDLMTGPDETVSIRQQLFPHAGGGPVAHVPAGQSMEPPSAKASTSTKARAVRRTTPGAWSTVDPDVFLALHEIDLPGARSRLLRTGTRVLPVTKSWTTIHDDRSGLSIDIPKRWTAGPTVMLPQQVDPIMPIAAGTASVEAQPEGECAIMPRRALDAVGPEDVFVGVYVNQGMASWSATTDRPQSFAADLPWSHGRGKCGDTTNARLHWLSFEDRDARISLLVATGAHVTATTRAELVAVLDSLRVG